MGMLRRTSGGYIHTGVMLRKLLVSVPVVMALTMVWAAPRTFKPDFTFSGNSLAGWPTLGQAEWKAQSGEIIGTPKSAAGGWLLDGSAVPRRKDGGGDEGDSDFPECG
jgi:hypothetical protein